MAHKMQALAKYGPRIAAGQPVHSDEFVETMSKNTGQSSGEVLQSVRNTVETTRDFLRRGRSVHIDELGTLTVDISLDGTIAINFRPDPDLADYVHSNFRGVIENGENVGKKMVDLIALWNADPANANNQIPTA